MEELAIVQRSRLKRPSMMKMRFEQMVDFSASFFRKNRNSSNDLNANIQ
jgi:hypothetical protein